MMDLIVKRLDEWFADRLRGLKYTPETIAYVAGVLAKRHHREQDDMSRESVVLAYHDASIRCDFARFQRIGDWVLFTATLHPEFIKDNRKVVETIGRQSYLSCHRILRGQWHCYEEIADELPLIAALARQKLV